jgi:predicted AlkP superfamily pyrophosphatase or phosphodiesterase
METSTSGRRVFVVIFGGMDYNRIRDFNLENICQHNTFGRLRTDCTESTQPDEIIASLITGRLPNEHGVNGSLHYTNPNIQWVERKLPNRLSTIRKDIYTHLSRLFKDFSSSRRRYIASDIQTDTIFDQIESSKPLFIPSYNPEIQWCVYRNTIRPSEHPGLGTQGAIELIKKNYFWRRQVLQSELTKGHKLLMTHFQCVDSFQHVFDEDLDDLQPVQRKYNEIDKYCGELKEQAYNQGFDNVVFMSEHGKPSTKSGQTHRRSAFYSTDFDIQYKRPSITDFYDILLESCRES